MKWTFENINEAKKQFQISAKEVIEFLKEIESELK